MHDKTVLPLALLDAAGGRIKGKTRFQKLAFLANQRLEDKGISPYDFVPYDYGPFDKALLDELESLEEEGAVEISKTRTYGGDTRHDYSLTRHGRKRFKNILPDDPETEDEHRIREIYEVAEDVVSEYNDLPISNLIDYVYEEYPEYAQNSVLY